MQTATAKIHPRDERDLLFDCKNQIDGEFRRYCADLAYDLQIYRRLLDSLERRQTTDERQPGQGRQAVIESEGPEFFRFLDKALVRLERLAQRLPQPLQQVHRFYFRQQMWGAIMASAFLARTNLRPRGYAGDSVLMRWIYQRGHVGETAFGCLMHRHPLETPAAQAVRNRRAFIADLARRMTSAAGGDVPLRIMSIACGPAWEVRDLFQRPEDGPRFAVTLLDQDSRALAEARTGVLQLQRGLGIPINARLVQGSVRQLIRSQHPAQTWGRHRLIYSMGLFDYLQHEFAARLASQLFDMLEPGGKLVVGNYHVGNPTRCYMEYWMDWPLVHRTEEEMRSLADGLPGAEASLSFEDTGCQMFLELTRPPDPA